VDDAVAPPAMVVAEGTVLGEATAAADGPPAADV